MRLHEFRYNKNRKHYCYIYNGHGNKRKNLLISDENGIRKKKKLKSGAIKIRTIDNVPLTRHPNPNQPGKYYLMKRIYEDDVSSFGRERKNWSFHPDDIPKVNRLKK